MHPIEDYVKEHRTDAFLYKAKYLFEHANDPDSRADALDQVAAMAACISNEMKRQDYLKILSGKDHLRISMRILDNAVKKVLEHKENELSKAKTEELRGEFAPMPEYANTEDIVNYGFYEDMTFGKAGYYMDNSGSFTRISNFVITPLFHKLTEGDNSRIMELFNGIRRVALEIPSKLILNKEQLSAFVAEKGNFRFLRCTDTHYSRIMDKIFPMFEPVHELKALGYQPEGFFAYTDCVVIPREDGGEVIQMDERGLIKIGDDCYFSPGASNIRKGRRKSDKDEYENDRFLSYKESKISFEEWSVLFFQTYGFEKAAHGMAFIVMSLFLDIVVARNNKLPYLYGYGVPGSGKSEFQDSVLAFFFNNIKPFGLGQGTDFALFNLASRFKNCPAGYNEFDEQRIRESFMMAFKSFYDRQGRERGKGGSANRVEIQDVNTSFIFVGQTLSTSDNSAILERAIPVLFNLIEERDSKQVKAFRKLKEVEKTGISSLIVVLLRLRKKFETEFSRRFENNSDALKEAIKKDGKNYKDRTLENFCVFLTSFQFISEAFKLPIAYDEYFDFVKREIIHFTEFIQENNSLAEFWDALEHLQSIGQIAEGIDYKIEEKNSQVINSGRNETKVIEFPQTTKLIFLRLKNIHPHYMKLYRQTKGTTAVTEASLREYMKSYNGYLGNNYKDVRFNNADGSGTATSCVIFEYDKLPLSLEREVAEEKGTVKHISGYVLKEPEAMEILGVPKVKLVVEVDDSYVKDGVPVRKTEKYNCYSAHLNHFQDIAIHDKIQCKGLLKINSFKNNEGNNIKVLNLDIDELVVLAAAKDQLFKKNEEEVTF